MDISELSARLERLEDERAIYGLLCRYGEALDYGLADQFVDCFTEDGKWILRRDGADDLEIAGRVALLAFGKWHSHYPDVVHKHNFGGLQIDLQGAEATAKSYFFRLDASIARDEDDPRASDSFIFEFGRYLDTLVKVDGVWRFAQRIVKGEDDRGGRPLRQPQ